MAKLMISTILLVPFLLTGEPASVGQQTMISGKAIKKNGQLICSYSQYATLQFPRGSSETVEGIPSADECAQLCWLANSQGVSCIAVNYNTDKKCQLMKTDPMWYFTDVKKNSTSTLILRIDCREMPPGQMFVAMPEPNPGPGDAIPAGSCGKTAYLVKASRKHHRIVGGQEATRHSLPWIVSIRPPGPLRTHFPHWCGASVIRVRAEKEESDIVITAAHCLDSDSLIERPFHVAIGAHYRNQTLPGENYIKVSKDVLHENYDIVSKENDIAILKLEQPVKFSKTIQPICLPEKDPGVGTSGTVAGWGDLKDSDYVGSYKLMQVDVPVMKNCTFNSTICGGFPQGQKDSCQGDSGGPYFFRNKNGDYTLHGVVSNGQECAIKDGFGAYTRVTSYLGWIQGKIEQLSDVYKKKN